MQELLTNRKWRLRNSLWILLAMPPYISCLAFFHIGYKVKRRSWTLLGLLFAVLWVVYSFVSSLTDYHAYVNALLLLLLVSSPIAALLLRNSYLKLLADQEARQPEPPAPMTSRSWRIQNSLWILWSLLPGLGAVGIIHANHRLKSRRLAVAGVLFAVFDTCYVTKLILQSVGVSYIGYMGMNYLSYQLANFRWGWIPCVTLFIVQFYICCAVRRSYLYTIAPAYEQTRRDYPCLTSWGWRTLQSWWIPVSLIPYCAGTGLIFAGAQTQKRKWLIGGVALTILTVIAAIVARLAQNGAMAATEAGQIAGYAPINFFRLVHLAFSLLLAIGTFAASTILREDYLVNRAARLNGYAGQIDRELAEKELLRRFAEKQNPAAGDAVPPKPAPTPENTVKKKAPRKPLFPRKQEAAADAAPVNTPAPQPEAPSGTRIDINTCQESELRTLPGVGVTQAKQAMDYRDQHGGFASVDEFVDVLALKPHFAVQIFRVAEASPLPENPQEQKPAKRAFDL